MKRILSDIQVGRHFGRPLLALICLIAFHVASASAADLRVGIIGLDTSHAIAFTKILNDANPAPEVSGCRVVAAYPKGSADIATSVSRVPDYIEDIKKLDVEIVDSIEALLERVDVVLLETNDGRPHLEQLRPCLKAGKPTFIDKPVAGSLEDAIKIYKEAAAAKVPIFSSSSLRYGKTTQAARNGSLGKISYCETHSPASLEVTHPDLFWYGIHGVESLFTVMGVGCESVVRSKSEDGKIVVTGTWEGGRKGVYREGKGYGGMAKGDKGEGPVGSYDTYRPLIVEIVKFFHTKQPPVSAEETLEIYAFMEAVDESKRLNGAPVKLATMMERAISFKPLFNGKDLSGWKGLVGSPKSRAAMPAEQLAEAQRAADQEMREHWRVVDGALQFDGKGKSLCTAKDYGDFELYLDWKILEGGDSGIYLRGSPQVQIWDTDFEKYFSLGADKGSGAFWNNKTHPRFPSKKGDKPVGQWNTFHITMIGERTTVQLNHHTVVDNVVMENYWERERPIYRTGQIELQNHGNTLFFRNLRIREIGANEANRHLAAQHADEFQPLFNGKDLTGWHGDTQSYEVRGGAIYCKAGQGGNLLADQEFDNFVARMEFKLPPGGNNGLAVRFDGKGRPHLDGFELQVLDSEHEKYASLHPTQYHGSVYGLIPAHRGYLRPSGQWNFQQVTVDGTKVKVELNGFTILDGDLADVKQGKDGDVPAGALRRSGFFGFAGHNDPVAFRNISIKQIK